MLGAFCAPRLVLLSGAVTSESSLYFSVNREKMEPLHGKVSREPEAGGPGPQDAVTPPTWGLALPLVPAAGPHRGQVQERCLAQWGILWIHAFHTPLVCMLAGSGVWVSGHRASLEHGRGEGDSA